MAEKRIFWYDVVRVTALLMVLGLHCYYAKYPLGSPLPPAEVFWRLLIPFFVLQNCIGLFVMLSGALIIKKELAEGCPFYWRRMAKFLFLLVFWSVATNACSVWSQGLPLRAALKQALANNTIIFGGLSGTAEHLWFLPLIAHLYLAAPFLARMVREMRPKDYLLFAGLTCGLLLLPATLNINGQFHSVFNAAFSPIWGRFDVFGAYVSWFLLGYFLAEFDTEAFLSRWCRHYNWLIFGGLLVLTAGCFAGERLITGGEARLYVPFHSYAFSFWVFAENVLMFVLLKHTARYFTAVQGAVSSLSRCSFGVYLAHFAVLYFWLRVLAKFGITAASHGALIAACAFLGMLFISWGLVRLLYRVRAMRFLVS